MKTMMQYMMYWRKRSEYKAEDQKKKVCVHSLVNTRTRSPSLTNVILHVSSLCIYQKVWVYDHVKEKVSHLSRKMVEKILKEMYKCRKWFFGNKNLLIWLFLLSFFKYLMYCIFSICIIILVLYSSCYLQCIQSDATLLFGTWNTTVLHESWQQSISSHCFTSPA